jgi:hypothetical protein
MHKPALSGVIGWLLLLLPLALLEKPLLLCMYRLLPLLLFLLLLLVLLLCSCHACIS